MYLIIYDEGQLNPVWLHVHTIILASTSLYKYNQIIQGKMYHCYGKLW